MTLLRSKAREGKRPDEILRQLNDELLEQNPRGMFVTLQCLLFDLAARTVTCASAGHHAAIKVSPGQPPQEVFTTSGRVLGLMPSGQIDSETIALHPGDTLVLFTDGVSEAFDINQELFGEERLLAHLASAPGASARETTLGCARRRAPACSRSEAVGRHHGAVGPIQRRSVMRRGGALTEGRGSSLASPSMDLASEDGLHIG